MLTLMQFSGITGPLGTGPSVVNHRVLRVGLAAYFPPESFSLDKNGS